MITLSDGLATVTLPADLVWTDEYDWAPVEQSVDRSITGALIVATATRQGGRPITLGTQTDDRAWMPTTTLEQCRAWAAVPGKVLTLTLRGVSRSVIWRHHDSGGALAAKQVRPLDDVQPTDDWICTLRFMEL